MRSIAEHPGIKELELDMAMDQYLLIPFLGE